MQVDHLLGEHWYSLCERQNLQYGPKFQMVTKYGVDRAWCDLKCAPFLPLPCIMHSSAACCMLPPRSCTLTAAGPLDSALANLQLAEILSCKLTRWRRDAVHCLASNSPCSRVLDWFPGLSRWDKNWIIHLDGVFQTSDRVGDHHVHVARGMRRLVICDTMADVEEGYEGALPRWPCLPCCMDSF